MKQLYFKKWYLILSLFLSLYLVAVTIIGFTPISKEIKAPLDQIAHYILWFFVVELVVIFFQTKDFKTFFKQQWLSIIAVVSSISATFLVDAIVGIGSLTGLKALKGIKSLKALKSMKLFKATKSVKLAKSYKIGKKASKAARAVEEAKKVSVE